MLSFRLTFRFVVILALLLSGVYPSAVLAFQAVGNDARVVAPSASLGGSGDVWRLRIREAAAVQGDMGSARRYRRSSGGTVGGRLADACGKTALACAARAGQTPSDQPSEAGSRVEGKPRRSCRILHSAHLAGHSAGRSRVSGSRSAGACGSDADPQINLLGGHGELTDFRLPAYAFTAHEGQTVELERGMVAPGRIGLRFAVKEMDGTARRRFTGSVFLNLWMDVPCAAVPLNRGDAVSPEKLTFHSENLAYARGAIWDGRGGPWQAKRAIGIGEAILADDLEPLAAIHRGDRVTLVYRRGNVVMRTLVEALEEGGPGDTIAVRNLSSKKQIYATVRDSNTVETK